MHIKDWDGHRPVYATQVAKAKEMLRNGSTLDQAAIAVGCLRRDLDRGLWSYIGIDLTEIVEPPKPEPMF